MALVKFSISNAPAETESGDQHQPVQARTERSRHAARIEDRLERIHESWELDIPTSLADQYIQGLSSQSFFNTERHGAQITHVAVTIDGKTLTKDWDPIPELDALAGRCPPGKDTWWRIIVLRIRTAPAAVSSPAWRRMAIWWPRTGEGSVPGAPPHISAFSAVPPPAAVVHAAPIGRARAGNDANKPRKLREEETAVSRFSPGEPRLVRALSLQSARTASTMAA